jgi:chorismate lyase/3-hydroxybenzoate synthase
MGASLNYAALEVILGSAITSASGLKCPAFSIGYRRFSLQFDGTYMRTNTESLARAENLEPLTALQHRITTATELTQLSERALLAADFSRRIPEASIESGGLTLLGGDGVGEAWLGASAAKLEDNNTVRVRELGNYLVASTQCVVSNPESIESQTKAAYQSLLTIINARGKANLVRCWNYVPFINVGEGDGENYKRFCDGRLQAFSDAGLAPSNFSAASAVGGYSELLTITLLATDLTTEHHGNRLQVNAYEYPRVYGKSSPSFARATSVDNMLFISGTASITGHQSLHTGDLKKQLELTATNVDQLLHQSAKTRANIQTMRVYLRHPEDLASAQAELDLAFPEAAKIYLHADICRQELLVEVEAFCR